VIPNCVKKLMNYALQEQANLLYVEQQKFVSSVELSSVFENYNLVISKINPDLIQSSTVHSKSVGFFKFGLYFEIFLMDLILHVRTFSSFNYYSNIKLNLKKKQCARKF